MFPFPGYHPRNYKPGPPADEPPLATDQQVREAIFAKAQFIHKNGLTVWRWRYDKLQRSFWDAEAGTFGSWYEFENEKLPAGELVEL